jgi:microcystin-dependent protein
MDAFLGEIRPFAISFAPAGWALCNGQIFPILRNQALFSLLGTRYGGDGQATFGLPNIQGVVLVGSGTLPGGHVYEVGKPGGIPDVSLQTADIPGHSHAVNGLVTTDLESAPSKGVSVPTNTSYLSNMFEVPPYTTKRMGNFYATTPTDDSLNPQTVTITGKGEPHSNMQPYLVINYCICLNGRIPPRP